MLIGVHWTFSHPQAWRETQRLLASLQVPLRKCQMHYAYWADLPKANM